MNEPLAHSSLNNIQKFLNSFSKSLNYLFFPPEFMREPLVFNSEPQLPDLWLKTRVPIDRNEMYVFKADNQNLKYKKKSNDAKNKREKKHYTNSNSNTSSAANIASVYFPIVPLVLKENQLELKVVKSISADNLFNDTDTDTNTDAENEENKDKSDKRDSFPITSNSLLQKSWYISVFINQNFFNYGPLNTYKLYMFLKDMYSKLPEDKKKNYMIVDIEFDIFYEPQILYEDLTEQIKNSKGDMRSTKENEKFNFAEKNEKDEKDEKDKSNHSHTYSQENVTKFPDFSLISKCIKPEEINKLFSFNTPSVSHEGRFKSNNQTQVMNKNQVNDKVDKADLKDKTEIKDKSDLKDKTDINDKKNISKSDLEFLQKLPDVKSNYASTTGISMPMSMQMSMSMKENSNVLSNSIRNLSNENFPYNKFNLDNYNNYHNYHKFFPKKHTQHINHIRTSMKTRTNPQCNLNIPKFIHPNSNKIYSATTK